MIRTPRTPVTIAGFGDTRASIVASRSCSSNIALIGDPFITTCYDLVRQNRTSHIEACPSKSSPGRTSLGLGGFPYATYLRKISPIHLPLSVSLWGRICYLACHGLLPLRAAIGGQQVSEWARALHPRCHRSIVCVVPLPDLLLILVPLDLFPWHRLANARRVCCDHDVRHCGSSSSDQSLIAVYSVLFAAPTQLSQPKTRYSSRPLKTSASRTALAGRQAGICLAHVPI